MRVYRKHPPSSFMLSAVALGLLSILTVAHAEPPVPWPDLDEAERRRGLVAWFDGHVRAQLADGWREEHASRTLEVWRSRVGRSHDELVRAARSVDLTIVDFRTTDLDENFQPATDASMRLELEITDLEAVYPDDGRAIPARYLLVERAVLTPWNTRQHPRYPEHLVKVGAPAFFGWRVNDGRLFTEWEFPSNFSTGKLDLGERAVHQTAPWESVPMARTDALISLVPAVPGTPGWEGDELKRQTLHPLRWLGSSTLARPFEVVWLLRVAHGEPEARDDQDMPEVRRLAVLERGGTVRLVALAEGRDDARGWFGVLQLEFGAEQGFVTDFQTVSISDMVSSAQDVFDIEARNDADGRAVPLLVRHVTSTTSELTRSLLSAVPALASVPREPGLHDREVHFLYHRINDEGIGRAERFDADDFAKRHGIRVALARERPLPVGQEEDIRRSARTWTKYYVAVDDETVIIGPDLNDFSFLEQFDHANRELIARLGLPIPKEVVIPYASFTYLRTDDEIDTSIPWVVRELGALGPGDTWVWEDTPGGRSLRVIRAEP